MSALQYLQFQHPFGLLHQRFSVWDETLHGDEFTIIFLFRLVLSFIGIRMLACKQTQARVLRRKGMFEATGAHQAFHLAHAPLPRPKPEVVGPPLGYFSWRNKGSSSFLLRTQLGSNWHSEYIQFTEEEQEGPKRSQLAAAPSWMELRDTKTTAVI